MAGFPLMAIGAGIGQAVKAYQEQQEARQRTMMLQMQLQRYQQEQDELQADKKAAGLAYKGVLGGGITPVGPAMPSAGGIPGAASLPPMAEDGVAPNMGRNFAPVPGKSNFASGLRKLTELGVNPDVAAGAVSYMDHNENGFNPLAINPTSGALGRAQWLGPRKAALVSQYGDRPHDDQQAAFMGSELLGPERSVLQRLLSAKTAKEGYDIWGTHYERPGAAALAKAGVGGALRGRPTNQIGEQWTAAGRPGAGYSAVPNGAAPAPGDDQTRAAYFAYNKANPNAMLSWDDFNRRQPAPQAGAPGGVQDATQPPRHPQTRIAQGANAIAQSIQPAERGSMSAAELARRIETQYPDESLAVKAKILEKQMKMLAPEARLEAQRELAAHREEVNKELRAQAQAHAKELAEARDKSKGWTFITQPDGSIVRAQTTTGVVEPTAIVAGSSKMGTGAGSAPPNPEQVDFVAKKIAAYEMAPLGAWAMRSPFGQQVMAKAAQINPEYDTTKYGAKARAAVTFTSGKQGDAIRAFSTSIDHLQTMQELGDALANNDVRSLNEVQARVQKELGYSGPLSFDFAKSIVGAEVSKAVIGGVGALKDREELRDGFNRANSPEQLRDVIETSKALMAGQLVNFRRQHAAAGLKTDDFDKQLSPKAKAQLMSLSAFDDAKPSAGAAPAATPGSYATDKDILRAIERNELTPDAGKKMLIDKFGYTPAPAQQ